MILESEIIYDMTIDERDSLQNLVNQKMPGGVDFHV